VFAGVALRRKVREETVVRREWTVLAGRRRCLRSPLHGQAGDGTGRAARPEANRVLIRPLGTDEAMEKDRSSYLLSRRATTAGG